MIALDLRLDGDRCWPDLDDRRIIHLGNGAPPIGLAVLTNGTQEGRESVTIRIDLPDGRVVLAETSLRLLCMAVDAMRARYGDQGGL